MDGPHTNDQGRATTRVARPAFWIGCVSVGHACACRTFSAGGDMALEFRFGHTVAKLTVGLCRQVVSLNGNLAKFAFQFSREVDNGLRATVLLV